MTTRRSRHSRPEQTDTLLSSVGRSPFDNHGVVNPPVYHASTIVFPTLEALREADRTPYDGTRYGRRGTPTTFALEEAVAELEGGFRCTVVPSGLSAITTSLLAFLGQGDHALIVDTVYTPTRRFCDTMLAGLGIDVTYYPPGADIGPLIRPETRVVFLESPGSLTYEIQDAKAIAAAARDANAVTILDNTWSAGLYFKPFEHGIDVSVQAATKYIVGHSDVLLGTITTTEDAFLRVRRAASFLGTSVGPDDCYLALRGLRTLSVRLERHAQTALQIARWLEAHEAVDTVLYPALPSFPDHDLWQRDFTGACGLVSILLKPCSDNALASMLDGLQHFAMGYSWGGFESLVVPFEPGRTRTATAWDQDGACLRLHCGLEDADDLIADLEAGLARLVEAS